MSKFLIYIDLTEGKTNLERRYTSMEGNLGWKLTFDGR